MLMAASNGAVHKDVFTMGPGTKRSVYADDIIVCMHSPPTLLVLTSICPCTASVEQNFMDPSGPKYEKGAARGSQNPSRESCYSRWEKVSINIEPLRLLNDPPYESSCQHHGVMCSLCAGRWPLQSLQHRHGGHFQVSPHQSPSA